MSSGVAVTFIFAYLLHDSSYAGWVPYIDPLLVVVMVVLILPAPLRTLRENLREVLMQAPSPDIQAEIRERIEHAVKLAEGEEIYIRMLPVGRFLYLQAHLLLHADVPLRGIAECDALRERIHESIADLHPQLIIDVIFTADRRWVGLETFH